MSIVDICVWPSCEASPSKRMALPLCDRHAIACYRKVVAAISATEPPRFTVNPNAPRRSSTARRNAVDAPGTVYFMRFGDRVKIGFTTNLPSRIRTLRPDELLATMPGTMRDERALHHRFGHAWIDAEMFEMTTDLAAFIEQRRAA